MSESKDTKIIINEKRGTIFGFFVSAFKFGLAIGIAAIIFTSFKSGSQTDTVTFNTTFENYNQYFANMNTLKSNKDIIVNYGKTMYLIDFNGTPSGDEVERLRRDIDFILINSKAGDEVAIRLTSPGGSVISYGLAASELNRLKNAELIVTVLVDKVAASGGYMMAVVSDKIIASPFAFVGSVGVVAQLPIYEDLLNKVGIEYKIYTAGDHKRNVVSQIAPTPEDEDKLKEDLEKIHAQFKAHVKKNRSNIDIDKIANGQVFSGQEAIDLKLVDELSTSSDYLLKQHKKNTRIIYVHTDEIRNGSNVTNIKANINGFIEHFAASMANEIKKELYNPYENIK